MEWNRPSLSPGHGLELDIAHHALLQAVEVDRFHELKVYPGVTSVQEQAAHVPEATR